MDLGLCPGQAKPLLLFLPGLWLQGCFVDLCSCSTVFELDPNLNIKMTCIHARLLGPGKWKRFSLKWFGWYVSCGSKEAFHASLGFFIHYASNPAESICRSTTGCWQSYTWFATEWRFRAWQFKPNDMGYHWCNLRWPHSCYGERLASMGDSRREWSTVG